MTSYGVWTDARYCASAMRPRKEMHMGLEVPVTGNWMMPMKRSDAYELALKRAADEATVASNLLGNGETVAESPIERIIDLEFTYYFNYDTHFSAYAQPGLAPTGLALRRVLRSLLLGSRNRSKIHPKSIGLLIVLVS